MAGYRRARGAPLRRNTRVERRTEELNTKLDACRTDVDRLRVAYEFAWGALSRAKGDTSAVTSVMVSALRSGGVSALSTKGASRDVE